LPEKNTSGSTLIRQVAIDLAVPHHQSARCRWPCFSASPARWTFGCSGDEWRTAVSEFVERLLPWMLAGFVVQVVSGALLFYSNPCAFTRIRTSASKSDCCCWRD
jgi:hypothetical protein